ncbi:SAM-dependent methyltransferase [cyanobacterium TDX16]|nr:SAM-dependent methyltransferase [cyanobacterium TDX16]
MNENHELCASPEWRTHVQTTVLPAVLAEVDLGDDLLEVGPGYGATTDWLRNRVDRLTVVEVDGDLAGPLERRYAGSNVRVVRGDATEMDFDDARFSAGVSFFMLHHVPSPEAQDRLFAEVARVLAPGAPFVAVDSLHSDDLEAWHVGDTFNPIDPDGLATRLVAAGMVEPEVQMHPDAGWIAHARMPTLSRDRAGR